MRAFALCFLLAAACPPSNAPAPPVAASAPKPPTPPARAGADAGGNWTSSQEACVDRWLAGHGLDAYGSPLGTMYMGGTPLFDEASGQRLSRQAFLAAHHPDALRACGFVP